MSRNLGALTSWNTVGLFKAVMGQLYLYLYLILLMQTVVVVFGNKFVLIWILSHKLWWIAQVLPSARQTERLDLLSLTWQQQNA
jgi:hypothetical protein